MDEQKTAREKLQRIRQLWLELERLEEHAPEYEIVTQKIRVLSAEYKTLIEATAKRGRPANSV
jgi:hypothetical protein